MNKGNHHMLIKFVERKLELGESQNWTNGDFEELSARLRRETKVYISVATLKRIFGKVKVKEGYSPHQSTIDALKKFVDFDQRIKDEEKKSQTQRRQLLWAAVVGSSLILLVSLGMLWKGRAVATEDINSVSLELTKIEGSGPLTAFFNIETQGQDGCFLYFGDESRPFKLPQKNSLNQPHFYAYPGYFRPFLKRKEKILAFSLPVLVETRGWESYAHYYQDESDHPRYFPLKLKNNSSEGVFHASNQELATLGLDTTRILVVRLDNYTHTGISSDHFSYEARLKNDVFWPGVRCYSMLIRIQGTEGKIEFKLVAEGCSGFSKVVLGNSSISTDINLTPLALDVTTWNTVQINHESGKVNLTVNDKNCFDGESKESLGELLGTSIIFHGSGKVDYVNLSTPSEKVFFNQFD